MCEGEILQRLKSNDPDLYEALKVLADRLKLADLTKQVVESVTPRMKVKELGKIIFSGQNVNIVHQGEVLFRGYANELPYCYFKDSEVRTIASSYNKNEISIMLEKLIRPKE